MNKLISIAAKYPLLVLFIIALITVTAVYKLDELRINISAEGMMVEHSQDRLFYQQTLDTFGSDNISIILIADDQLFTPDKLHDIRLVQERIETLPFVDHTNSLFTASNLKSIDGYVSTDPYLKEIPTSLEQLELIKTEALRNPLISGNLLSVTGNAMAINIHFKTNYTSESDRHTSEQIDNVLAPLTGKFKTVFQVGSPYIRNEITNMIREDQRFILPLSVLVLLVALAFSLRKINGAIVPLLTAGFSVVWTLGLMAFLNIPINVITSIVPALLIIIGSTEDIHLLAEYYAGTALGMKRLDAVHHMANNMGTAVLLTFITTYLGFLSISLNDIELLRQFGIVASTGLLLNFLITVLLIPGYLRYVGEKSVTRSTGPTDTLYRQLVRQVSVKVQANRRSFVILAMIVVIICGYGVISLRVNNTLMDYFGNDSTVISRMNTLQEQLSGVETFSIVLDSRIEDTFLKVRYLEEVQKLQGYLSQSGFIDQSLSFADFIAFVNNAIEEDITADPVLPPSDAAVQEYMNFINRDHVRGYISPDFSQVRILIRHHISSSLELKQVLREIQSFIDMHIDSGLDARITGESILTNEAADYMVSAQIKALLLIFLVIFVIISVLFVNMKAGLVAIVSNLFPIIVLFGVMGYAGIPLNIGTAMVAAIALGICVDHTMHFMVRYHRKTLSLQDERRALIETIEDESVPIMTASIALALGFTTLSASNFPPVVHFGLLSAMVMLLALMATFIITPIMLSSIRLITLWDILSLNLKPGFIKRCELFRDMRPWQIKKIVLASKVQEVNSGEVIVRQGDTGDEMFILLEGGAEVWQNDADGLRKKIRSLAAGEIFGEIALISHVARTADVIAQKHSKVLAFNRESINHLARVFPRISTKLFRNLTTIVSNKLAKAVVNGNEKQSEGG